MTKPVEELSRDDAESEWRTLRESLKHHPGKRIGLPLADTSLQRVILSDYEEKSRRLRHLIVRAGFEDGALACGRPALHEYDEDREGIDRVAAVRVAELRAAGDME